MKTTRHIIAALASFVLAGCASVDEKPKKEMPIELARKVALYKTLQLSTLDEYGFASIGGRCDSVLFTSLCLASGGCVGTDIYQAESDKEPGRWFRHAVHDCFDTGESSSDISKDMFAGLAFALDGAAKLRVKQYGESNNWIMGRGPITRTYLTIPLRWQFTDVTQTSSDDDSWLPFPINTGYRAHLDVLSILLRAMSRGNKTTQIELEYLKRQRNRVPSNALFQAAYHKYADGNQERAAAILLDEKVFPADDLPTEANYCTDYLWQRDKESDVLPCEGSTKKHGIDFIFAAWVAYGQDTN